MNSARPVYVVSASRIPFNRSHTHYMGLSNQELMIPVLQNLVEKNKLQDQVIGEVALGAVSKHQADWGLARDCTMDSGLSPKTPATDLQKACGTSLEATIFIANKIALGQMECGIAGGCDTNSDVPLEFSKRFSDRLLKLQGARSFGDKIKALKGFNPKELLPKIPAIREKRTGLSMGESAEIMAKRWGISRLEQDRLAAQSHARGFEAYESGFYNNLVISFRGLERDGLLRGDTNLEKLSKLKPVFDRSDEGTLTAGNSSSLTDGAAAVFLASAEYCDQYGLTPLARLAHVGGAAVDYVADEGLLMAPSYAIAHMLTRAKLSLQDFDYYEIHEAFAAQVLCNLKALNDADFCRDRLGLDRAMGEIDFSKMNLKGGSLALGHPFAATGARQVGTLASMIASGGKGKRGLISICTAGGMGVTAILESVEN
jgi:acetyl-CoA C-acetyltransferase